MKKNSDKKQTAPTEKLAVGRPTKYDVSFCDLIINYFKRQPQQVVYENQYYNNGKLKSERPIVLPAEFPTFQGFADEIGVHYDTLREWCDKHKDFSEAYMRAKQIQESVWLINGMSGHYNPQFAKFYGINCLGYKDKPQVDENKEVLDKLDDVLAKIK